MSATCAGCLPWRKSDRIAPGKDPREVKFAQENAEGKSSTARKAGDTTRPPEDARRADQHGSPAEERVNAEELRRGSTRGTNHNTIISLSKSGKLEELVAHLQKCPGDIEKRGMWGNTALICACANRHEAVALELLRQGAELAPFNEDGCTALHHACLNGLEEFVRAVARDLHARPLNDVKDLFKPAQMYNIKTDRKRPLRPLAAASVNEHVSIVELLVTEPAFAGAADQSAVVSAFRQAIEASAERSAGLLLATCRPSLTTVIQEDVSLLVRACKNEARSIIKLLIDAGCQVNACLCGKNAEMREGLGTECPLAVICTTGDCELLLDLLAAGADPNYTCGECSLPLMHACRMGEIDCASRLVESGAHANIPDPVSGLSPMQFVRNARMTEMEEALHGV